MFRCWMSELSKLRFTDWLASRMSRKQDLASEGNMPSRLIAGHNLVEEVDSRGSKINSITETLIAGLRRGLNETKNKNCIILTLV